MTLQTFYEQLKSTGMPVAYMVFSSENAPDMPFITYRAAYTNNFGADNTVQKVITHIEVTLWTQGKDLEAEAKLEEALQNLFWDKTETYIDNENCFEIIYDVEVIQ